MSATRSRTRTGTLALVAGTLLLAATAVPAAAATKSYTMAAVRAHRSAANCWTVVSGRVYNLTKWINRHPGGSSVIKAMCGRDATAAFKGQHGGQGEPAGRLASFKIGTLAKGASTPSATASPSPSTSAGATLNLALVATHNTPRNCWSIVNSNVYNLTSWVNVHPGGARQIEAVCGIDATAAFSGQHGTQREPNAALARFLVGAVGTAAP